MSGSNGVGRGDLEKLGFRLTGFREWPLLKAVDTLAEIGYRSVELCLEHPELDALKLTSAQIAQTRKHLEAVGLRISAVSYHGKRDSVADCLRKQMRGLEISQEFGVRVFVAGSALQTTDPEGCSTFRALDELVRAAEKTNVVVALEPEPDTVINGMYEFSLVAAHLAGCPLGLNLDLGHAALTEGDPAGVVEEWAPFIAHVHIEDMRKPRHEHLLPGDGHLDLLKLIRTLREFNYTGDITVDLFDILDAPEVYAKKAMERFRQLLA